MSFEETVSAVLNEPWDAKGFVNHDDPIISAMVDEMSLYQLEKAIFRTGNLAHTPRELKEVPFIVGVTDEDKLLIFSR